jgi:hypothetical protein
MNNRFKHHSHLLPGDASWTIYYNTVQRSRAFAASMEVMWKLGVDHMTMEFSSNVKHRGKIRRRMSSDQSSRKEKQRGSWGGLKEPDEISEVVREHRPDESGTVTPSKASKAGGRRTRTLELISIGFLWRAKLSFNRDRRSPSRFKVLSGSQKVNTSIQRSTIHVFSGRSSRLSLA